MKLTNKFNLPKTFVNALHRDSYTKGKAHLSVTEMINSPQIVMLTKEYGDQLTEDVTDRIWSLFGTAVHGILEAGKDDNHIVEQRLHAELDGWHLSGAIDLQISHPDGIEINDYKVTSVWSVMNDKLEWEQQLNAYAWLIERVKQVPVKSIKIVAILRDWSRRKAQTEYGYPESQVKVLDINLWPFQLREDFIKDRIHLHSEAHLARELGEDYSPCTPRDMWEKETTYAIKKTGNKRATSICKTQEEADEKIKELGKGYEVEVRKGERTRCAEFCQVSKFCKQYKEYLKQQEEVK